MRPWARTRARVAWGGRAAAGAALAAVLAAAPGFAAEAPSASARASESEVTVGETFLVEVKASGPAGTTFEFPRETAQETFELRTPPPPADPKAAPPPPPPGTYVYQAAVFATGDAQIPPIPVHYRLADGTTGEIATAPIPLRVMSLLPKEKSDQKLADVRGPVGVPLGRAFWVGVALLALLLGALVWWIARRKRREVPALVKAEPSTPPEDEARRALDALAASGRLARAEYRPFYIDLTAIAKRYLERRLGAPIVEMTTAEMLAHLKSDARGADLAPTLRDLSGAADQIKFARGRGLVEEAERHLAATRALIDTLETRLKAPAPAPAEGGKAA
jgi:hypothetical protein